MTLVDKFVPDDTHVTQGEKSVAIVRKLGLRAALLAGAALLAQGWFGARAQTQSGSLPIQPPPFAGKIDADRNKSKPDWPKPVQPAKTAPNIVLVLLDDVGFGASAITGGPVNVPELEKLAQGGLRYNNFHVNALCSPTRAALLSGRNDHQLGFGTVTEGSSGYPGYNSLWPKSASSIAEVLKDNGYSTAAFGKWHNTPTWEVGPAGPFTHWPTSLGFEYFYGFLAGLDNQWEPHLYRNTSAVDPGPTPGQGYHLTIDLANDAIHWLHQHDAVAPGKPFFLYFATGATHEPHQVPQVWIDKYKGKFDQGWDKLREETFARQKAAGVIPANAELTPRPAEIPAWDSLTPAQKQLLSHQAEVYAGFLEQTDHQVGRILDAIHAEGKDSNTLVFYIVGDNGASAEGGLEGEDAKTVAGKNQPVEDRNKIAKDLGSDLYFNHYAVGWAWGLDAPFQWTKQVASHLGGTTDPLVVSWPARISDHGAVRDQFQHVTDIAPTIFDVAGITPPAVVDGVKQLPLEGHSLAASFTDAKAPSTHHVQFFEMVGNRGIYKDGWWAGSRHLLPWESFAEKWETTPVGNHPWELYNLTEDYSQAHDLATANPAKLKELVALFDSEAKRNNVYPLVPHFAPQPSLAAGRTHFVFRGDVDRIPQQDLPSLRGKAHTITASVNVPAGGGNGVILADGGRYGGFVLYVQDGKPIYEVSAYGNVAGRIVGANKLAEGNNVIEVVVTPDQTATKPEASIRALFGGVPTPATAVLKVNGKDAGKAAIANYAPIYGETLDVGEDLASTVSAAYTGPAKFQGEVQSVTLDLK
jgi:arylsulfatase